MNAQYFRQFIWREIAKLRLRSSILYLRDQANLTFFYIAKYSLNRVFIIATTDNETLQERRLASSVQAGGQHPEEY